jgi:hypothetical protein
VDKPFRKAFVVEKGKLNDMPALELHTDEVIYLLQGTEKASEISRHLEQKLEDFNIETDVIIPTGRSFVSLLLGYALRDYPTFVVGIYENKAYAFIKVFSRELERMIRDATV